MKIKLFFIVSVVLWILTYILVISTFAGYTSFKFKDNYKKLVFQVLPQGWGFFTRSPRDENLTIYKKNEEGELERLDNKNFTFGNFYGLSRADRIKHLQLGPLLAKANDSLWTKCENNDFVNCTSGLNQIKSINEFNQPLLKGEIFVVRQKLVPWAWSKNKLKSPAKIISLYVE